MKDVIKDVEKWIALSIMAEVVAVRNGRTGGRLSTASGRIHKVGT